MVTINEMVDNVAAKYGADSKEATLMKLVCISYRAKGKYTALDVKKTYEKLIKNA
jgi:hypothetical protein